MTDLDLQEQDAVEEKQIVEGNDNAAPTVKEGAEAEAEAEAEGKSGEKEVQDDATGEEEAAADSDGEAEALEESEAETESEDESEEGASGTEIDPQQIRLIEALLFSSTEPLTERLLKNRLPADANVKKLLKALQSDYAERGIQLVHRGQTWAFRTSPDLTTALNREVEVPRKLSRAAIETLAIIAYHQPITRAEIEEIRGVIISRGTIDILLELGWIGPRGRRQVPGRPMTWGTTDGFLDHFGLENTKDLPGMDELKAAGLLDASPAIQVYRASVGKDIVDQGVLEETPDEENDEEPLNPEA